MHPPGIEIDPPRPTTAQSVDAFSRCDLAQPEKHVRHRLQPAEIAIKLQKHILGNLFGAVAIGEEVQGDPEDHRFVLFDDCGECVVIPRSSAGESAVARAVINGYIRTIAPAR